MQLYPWQDALLFLTGAIIGCLIAWFVAKSRCSSQFSSYLVENSAEIATLSQTLRSRTSELEMLRHKLEQTQRELRFMNADFLEISKAHSAAMSRLDLMAALEQTLDERNAEVGRLNALISDLKKRQGELETSIETERIAHQEKLNLLENFRDGMTDTFKAISATALKDNNQSFLDLAGAALAAYLETARTDFDLRSDAIKDVVTPVKEALDRYDNRIQMMERAREKAYGALSEQVHSLVGSQQSLQKETGKLVKALRVPHVRGRWGEITLKRVAELAGMQNRCDFFEQPSVRFEDGALRPDMIVRLPGNRQIIVDAKVPLAAYLEALEAETDQTRQIGLSNHLKQLESHIAKLAQKAYWKQFKPTPEFVVLFIPGENFFSAALTQNPRLIEKAIEKGIVLATPTTLISLLKAVAFGWQQEKVTDNARAISELGRELYERLGAMANHMNRVGRNIERCSTSYNELIGSLERRVFVSARRFNTLGVSLEGEKELPAITPVERKIRKIEVD